MASLGSLISELFTSVFGLFGGLLTAIAALLSAIFGGFIVT
jgi:hypothetical protein